MEIEESEMSDNEHHSDEEDQIGSQESEMLDCIVVQTNNRLFDIPFYLMFHLTLTNPQSVA